MKKNIILGNIELSFPTNLLDSLIFQFFKQFGYFLIPDWRLRSLPLVSHLKKIFDRYQINCVIDVGANTGQFGLFLIQHLNFQGKIISIEPVKEFFQELSNTAKKYPNWEVYNLAIGNDEIEQYINITATGVLSSFLVPDTNSLPDYQAIATITREERVECIRLDSFLNDLGLDLSQVFLKSDTQGYEPQVVESMGQLLFEIPSMMLELSVQSYYRGALNYQEMIKNMSERNFILSNMFHGAIDQKHNVIEFDAIFNNMRFA